MASKHQKLPIIGIYKITSPNKRVYIGQSVDIERRFNDHRLYNKNQKTKLKKSFDKYGADKHQFEILCECDTSALNRIERYYQDLFNCLSQKYGLNCIATKYGDRSGYHSEETKIKMSLASTGRTFSKETLIKLSQVKKGVTSGAGNGFFNKKHTEESKKTISIKLKERDHRPIPRRGSENNKSRLILDISNGVFYETITEASFAIGIKRSTLNAMVTGQNKNKTSLRYV